MKWLMWTICFIGIVGFVCFVVAAKRGTEAELEFMVGCHKQIRTDMYDCEVQCLFGRDADLVGKSGGGTEKLWLACGYRFDVQFFSDGKFANKHFGRVKDPSIWERCQLLLVDQRPDW